MLHEVLLALCGFPSPLFEANGIDAFPLVTPAESALLRRLGHLAGLNRALRSHVTRLVQVHEVLVCKAVATAIRQNHLSKFQSHVLLVEKQILSKDSSRVGAYNIVPLASLTGEFEPWKRTLEWLWDLSCFILPQEAHADADLAPCSGADLLERLRQDALTGYPDIRAAALDLLGVAESTWLRQLVHWLLQTAHGASDVTDFFIEIVNGPGKALAFTVVSNRTPSFVSDASAESILYLGKMLSYMSRGWAGTGSERRPKLNTLELAQHFRCLTALPSPVASTSLASAISDVRMSVSSQVIHGLLPIQKVIATVTLMREFFLLGKPSFADAMIIESESILKLRSSRINTRNASNVGTSLAEITLKESEVSQVITRALASLAPWIGKEASLDSDTEWARDNLCFKIARGKGDSNESFFHDLLLGTPASLTLQLRSPLDLFLRQQEVDTYSSMHTYLVAIRRGQLRLAESWRQTLLRKEHPAPRGLPASALDQRRLFQVRMKHTRRVWHTMHTTQFLLSELGNYLVVEVIGESWARLLTWMKDGIASDGTALSNSATSATGLSTGHSGNRPDSQGEGLSKTAKAPQDPEVLTVCHRSYLHSLKKSLLLEDAAYIKALRTVLSQVDYLRAAVSRLLEVRRRADMLLLQDAVVEKDKHHYSQEEQSAVDDTVHAAKQLDADVKSLVACLQAINAKRVQSSPDQVPDALDFAPWSGGTLDGLLMRLNL